MLQITMRSMSIHWKDMTPSLLQRHDNTTSLRHHATSRQSRAQPKISNTDVIVERQSTNNDRVDQHHCRTKPNNMTHTYYITIDPIGRLGNQMFIYATLQGLALGSNHTPIVRCTLLAKHFSLIASNCIPSKNELLAKFPDNKNCTVKLREKHSGMYETAVVDGVKNSRGKNVHIAAGYYQSWKYFRNVTHIIRKHFQYDSNVMTIAKMHFQSLIDRYKQITNVTASGDVTTIGIHVRRGDFLSSRAINRGKSVGTVDYFHAAMRYFRKQHTNCVFLVASNDVKWCREHLAAHDVIMIADSTVNVTSSSIHVSDVQRDMSILRLVEHNIISTGSFSWWIGWFTRGQVVYYKDFPANGSSLSRDLNKDDYYPQQWIAM